MVIVLFSHNKNEGPPYVTLIRDILKGLFAYDSKMSGQWPQGKKLPQ